MTLKCQKTPKNTFFSKETRAIAQRVRAHTGGAHICCTHTAPTHMAIAVDLLSPPVHTSDWSSDVCSSDLLEMPKNPLKHVFF